MRIINGAIFCHVNKILKGGQRSPSAKEVNH